MGLEAPTNASYFITTFYKNFLNLHSAKDPYFLSYDPVVKYHLLFQTNLLNIYLLVAAQGRDGGKRGTRYTQQLLVGDGWRTASEDGAGKCLPFVEMSLVLAHGGFAHFALSVVDSFQRAVIIQHGHFAGAEDLDPLLCKCLVAVGKVIHHTNGAIREGEGHSEHILTRAAVVRQAVGCHREWRCPGQECQEINEVAAFPDDATAALDRIMLPVGQRQGAGIDPVMGKEGFLPARQEFRQLLRQGCKTAVETGHQQGHTTAVLIHVFFQFLQLFQGHRQWFLYENMLASLQSLEYQRNMAVVAGQDCQRIDIRVVDQLPAFRSGITELEFVARVPGMYPPGRGNSHQLDVLLFLDGWQHDGVGKQPCSHHPQAYGFFRHPGFRVEGYPFAFTFLLIFWIGE